MQFKISSSAFPPNGAIPDAYTCEGADTPPPLRWTGAPDGTKSFALIVDDPDAPDPKAPKMTYVHWVLYDIPTSVTGVGGDGATPSGAHDGVNDWKRRGYGGPCPPIGRHRYFFKIYALDVVLGDLGSPTKTDVEAAMRGHMLAQAELMGTYQRAKAGAK
jgi:Raf kinase inhibitor-like YbhB/YbcL family protein